MGVRVGIDIGTTYSKIAFVNNDGHPMTIDNIEGSHMTPSVVFFDSPDIVVGFVAKECAIIEPEKAVSEIRSLIGKTDYFINYNNHNWTPEEVMSLLIKKLVNDAKNVLGADIEGAVITVPAYFGRNECDAIKCAGETAGVNVLGELIDTTAAALFYGFEFDSEKHTALIYDLGNTSFGVSVVNVNQRKIEIVCTESVQALGGKNWDDAVMQYLADKFCSETGFDGDFDEHAQQDLRFKAEKAKQQLSSREEVHVMFNAVGLRARISISRTTFDEITQTLLNESIEKTAAAIAAAESKGYKVDEILLVGGSTRMPQVTKALFEKYGIKPKCLEPDLAIAKGAAIYAALL